MIQLAVAFSFIENSCPPLIAREIIMHRIRRDPGLPYLLIFCCLYIVFIGTALWPRKVPTHISFPLKRIAQRPGLSGATDTLVFIIRTKPHQPLQYFRLPSSKCRLSYDIWPGRFGWQVADGDTQYFFRPDDRVNMALPYPFPKLLRVAIKNVGT